MSSDLDVTQSVIVSADRERVWQAITQPKEFGKWFEADVHWVALAVGEEMMITADGQTGAATIAVVDPPEEFAFRWTPEPNCDVRTLVTFRLEKLDEGTRVTVTEEGFENLPEDVRESRSRLNNEGWVIQMNTRLASYLQAPVNA